MILHPVTPSPRHPVTPSPRLTFCPSTFSAACPGRVPDSPWPFSQPCRRPCPPNFAAVTDQYVLKLGLFPATVRGAGQRARAVSRRRLVIPNADGGDVSRRCPSWSRPPRRDYFVLYVEHDLDGYKVVEIPVLVKRGSCGASDHAGRERGARCHARNHYRVEKYAASTWILGRCRQDDCIDDLTELSDPVRS